MRASHLTTKSLLCVLLATVSLQAKWVFAQGQGQTDLLQSAIESSSRLPANVKRDKYRRPYETLTFFGIKPNMIVVEINPSTSLWYIEILAPYLREQGRYYAASYDKDSDQEGHRRGYAKFSAQMAARPALFDKAIVTVFSPPHKLDIAPTGSADMVLTFRDVHNWMRIGGAEEALAAFYKTLKPGGVLGVVEHRAENTHPQDPKALNAYVREDYLIKLVESVGFVFVAKSDLNANPKDTKDYEAGAWALPPTLRSPEALKAKRLAIGESDRVTMKFVKPLKGD